MKPREKQMFFYPSLLNCRLWSDIIQWSRACWQTCSFFWDTFPRLGKGRGGVWWVHKRLIVETDTCCEISMCQGLVTYNSLPGIVDGPMKTAYIMEEQAMEVKGKGKRDTRSFHTALFFSWCTGTCLSGKEIYHLSRKDCWQHNLIWFVLEEVTLNFNSIHGKIFSVQHSFDCCACVAVIRGDNPFYTQPNTHFLLWTVES